MLHDRERRTLVTSRWRPDGAARPVRGAAGRVREAQGLAAGGLRLAIALVAAAAAATIVPHRTGNWLPLHLFLAGGVVVAISAVSVFLTATWSAASPPTSRAVVAQRSSVAAGAVGLAVGREADVRVVTIVAAVVFVAGLVGLGALLVATVRRGVERRFDPAVGAYLAAVLAGIVGSGAGAVMATSAAGTGWRAAHLTLNLLGLVGLVVTATLPYFAATVGRARMSRRATPVALNASTGWQVAAVATTVGAFAAQQPSVAALGLGAYAAGVVAVLVLLPRPTRRQLSWAGPRLVGVWLGTAWISVAVAGTALDVARHEPAFGSRWLGVLVVGGLAQVLWGSLAYLLPMLRGGGHERLARGFATTRSWPALVAANLAALAVALATPVVALVAGAAWVADTGGRVVRLRRE
ncbi:MAG: hypothetical protein S0880_07700 [Actinomycetota bacterium]|nr:hypothetical protein [Actinomycetota bacterium]